MASSSSNAPVLQHIDGAILHIVLNQPAARNPLGAQTVEALDDAAQVFAAQMRRDAVEGVRAAREKRAPVWPD